MRPIKARAQQSVSNFSTSFSLPPPVWSIKIPSIKIMGQWISDFRRWNDFLTGVSSFPHLLLLPFLVAFFSSKRDVKKMWFIVSPEERESEKIHSRVFLGELFCDSEHYLNTWEWAAFFTTRTSIRSHLKSWHRFGIFLFSWVARDFWILRSRACDELPFMSKIAQFWEKYLQSTIDTQSLNSSHLPTFINQLPKSTSPINPNRQLSRAD